MTGGNLLQLFSGTQCENLIPFSKDHSSQLLSNNIPVSLDPHDHHTKAFPKMQFPQTFSQKG